VQRTATGEGVFALRALSQGDRILEIEGEPVPAPTRHSIQLNLDLHIECTTTIGADEMRVRFPWRFLNHCCEPNASVLGRTLVARRAIAAGEEITFDYTTTEAAMAEPFRCGCGAARCLGEVRGFLALTPDEQRARTGFVAPHLKAFLPKPQA
jgi:hypothetical protein